MTDHFTKKNLPVFLLLAVLGFIFYFPILNNEFLSDDYLSLYRIRIEKQVLIKGFLRPLMDVSFYFNNLISGLNAWSYYLLNLLIHIANAFLLYRFALAFFILENKKQPQLAVMISCLFLVYPFHNEGVVWLTGRLASMAALFALLMLNVWISRRSLTWRVVVCIPLYVLGFLAYESILLLPFVLALLSGGERFSKMYFLKMGTCAAVITGAALLGRFFISGAVYGKYGDRLVKSDWQLYLERGLKTLGRSFLPPLENTALMIAAFILVTVVLIVLNFWILKKILSKEQTVVYYKLVGSFFIMMLLPMLFGVSTKTSEGDRLLYLPSLFLCMMLGYWIVMLSDRVKVQLASFVLLFCSFSYLVVMNNIQWEKASDAAAQLTDAALSSRNIDVYLVNVPDELEGAYVFRNGWTEAMVLKEVDTSRIHVINYLNRLQYLQLADIIQAQRSDTRIWIQPSTEIIRAKGDWVIKTPSQTRVLSTHQDSMSVSYWNRSNLVRLF